MKREWRDKWLAALRSGDFQQNFDCLWSDEEGDTYCCLGVLQDLTPFHPSEQRYRPESTLMHPEAARLVGLPSVRHPDQEYFLQPDSNIQVKLARLNSATGLDFEEIADWIEDHVPVED